MFCPECGEVVGPGPIDPRRASYCECGTTERAGMIVRLWRAIWMMMILSRARSVENRPESVNPSNEAFRNSSDRIVEE